MIILDTNALSEALKPAPSNDVLRWLASQEALNVFTTTITQAEILFGIEALPAGKRRQSLAMAAGILFDDRFPGRVLSFDEQSARQYPKIVVGRTSIGRPIAPFDAMIAAITRAHHATLATRNTRDFEHCGIRLVNPWIT